MFVTPSEAGGERDASHNLLAAFLLFCKNGDKNLVWDSFGELSVALICLKP
tara:strand:+ start:7899 stop:8051 length:153 start_codon:yes stop_codon:yes gene_type:complete